VPADQGIRLNVSADVQQVDGFTTAVGRLQTSADGLYRVLGQLGVIYAMQRAFVALTRSGSTTEYAFVRLAVTAGESRTSLEALARTMVGSIYGPQAMAAAMTDLAVAGADVREIYASLPAAIDWATASGQALETATAGLIDVAEAFGVEFEQAQEVADLFAAAMQSCDIRAAELGPALATVGPAARLAGQDMAEMTAAMSAMSSIGIDAVNGASALKYALMELSNPSEQARKLLESLGIELHDSAGRLKHWSDLVGEFQAKLAGLTDEARSQALITILGLRGVQAMAASLDAGSESLRQMAGALEVADGAALRTAQTMRGTFAGATRQAGANLERLAAAVFSDVEPALTGLLGLLSTLMAGFNALEPAGRGAIELLVGGAGLAVALKMVYTTLKQLLATLGIASATLKAISWPVSIVAGLITALLYAKGAQVQAARAAEEHDRSILDLAKALEKAETRLAAAKKGTDEYKAASDELLKVKQDIATLMPEMATAFDTEGKAVDILADKYRQLAAEAEASMRARLRDQIAAARAKQVQLAEDARRLRRGDVEGAGGLGVDTPAKIEAQTKAALELERQARETAAEVERLYAILEGLGGGAALEARYERIHPPRPPREVPGDKNPFSDQENEAIAKQIALFDHLVAIGDARVDTLREQLDWLGLLRLEMGTSWELEELIAQKRREYAQQGSDAYKEWLQAMEEADLAFVDKQVEAARRGLGARIDALRKASAAELAIRQEIEKIDRQLEAEDRQERTREFEASLADLQAEVDKVRADYDRQIAAVKGERQVRIVAGERRLTWDEGRVAELEAERAERLAEMEKQRQDLVRDRERELHRQQMEDRKTELQERLEQLQAGREREIEQLEKNLQVVADYWARQRELTQLAYKQILRDLELKQDAERKMWLDHYDALLGDFRHYLAERRRLAAEANAAAGAGSTGGGGGGTATTGSTAAAQGASSSAGGSAGASGAAAVAGTASRGGLTVIQNVTVHLPAATPDTLRQWGLGEADRQFRAQGYFDRGGARR